MSIFDQISFKVRDFEKSRAFYQAALAPLGIEQRFVAPRAEGFVAGFGRQAVAFFITGDTVSGNVGHMAFMAESQEQVNAVHAAGLAAGGRTMVRPALGQNTAPAIMQLS